jgi:hypothetical protein
MLARGTAMSLQTGDLTTVLGDHSAPEIWMKMLIPERACRPRLVNYVKQAFDPRPP